MKMNYLIQTRDVDIHDIMKPVAILDIFQDVSGIHAEALKVGYQDLRALGYAWVVLYQEFEIVNIPPYSREVEVVTWPKPKQRIEFEREFLMQSMEGVPLVKGISNWAVISLDDHRLVRASEVNFSGIYYDFTNYPEKTVRKLHLDATKIEDWFYHEVLYDDLDHNGHMNNARYVNIIYNHYPFYNHNQYINKVRIAYIKEAKYLEKIKFGHYSLEDKEAYIGYINDELCFECIVEVKNNE